MMETSFLNNNTPNATVFVGDLPKYCSEQDLFMLCLPFGKVSSVKVQRNANNGKALSYGFVTYASHVSAQACIAELNGSMFQGRRLRLNFGVHNAPKTAAAKVKEQYTNSIFIRYWTSIVDRYITEEDLQALCRPFGQIIDCCIKESSLTPEIRRQTGYGFIQFVGTAQGLESAINAQKAIHGTVIGGIRFGCELSKVTQRQIGLIPPTPETSPLRPHTSSHDSFHKQSLSNNITYPPVNRVSNSPQTTAEQLSSRSIFEFETIPMSRFEFARDTFTSSLGGCRVSESETSYAPPSSPISAMTEDSTDFETTEEHNLCDLDDIKLPFEL